ncbi:MAG: NAD(P)H-dependent oxidoreductase [Lentisphaerales bacterium]|nr:NAD(P)H-dependent oxidoreductase [Lentisphaerales bacterium]
MKTVLVILGAESGAFAGGKYNQGLYDAAVSHLSEKFSVITTVIKDGYVVEDEISKWKQADYIIYQYPIYWFMMPPSLKKYMDDVYSYGDFFAFTDGPYGSGGLMKGKKVMLSTTWNAPEEAFGSDFFDGADLNTVLLPMRKSQSYCGMAELEHFSAHNVIKNPQIEADQERFKSHLNKVFEIN